VPVEAGIFHAHAPIKKPPGCGGKNPIVRISAFYSTDSIRKLWSFHARFVRAEFLAVKPLVAGRQYDARPHAPYPPTAAATISTLAPAFSKAPTIASNRP